MSNGKRERYIKAQLKAEAEKAAMGITKRLVVAGVDYIQKLYHKWF